MLYGLLLVGGKSRRMGTDKSQLIYQNDTPEWRRLKTLLTELCEEVYLCHPEGQHFADSKSILDPGDGPLKAIHSAQLAHPEAAWLTLACDMPLLDLKSLRHLVESRDPSKPSTCYLSPIDQLPEPLCAIYEPSSSAAIARGIPENQLCPRSYLKDAHHVTPLSPHALINANSPADKIEVQAILEGTQTEKKLTLQYFAQLKELTKKAEEDLSTQYATASGLYEQIKTKYKFPYKQKDLMLAINDEYVSWEQLLKEGDNVVFIPPVAGG